MEGYGYGGYGERCGAVVVFADGVSKEDAEAAMKELVDKGLVDPSYYADEKVPVKEFEPQYGGPVWYVP